MRVHVGARCFGGALALSLAAAGIVVAGAPAQADATVGPDFAGQYSITDLGAPPGVPGPLGGLTIAAGDPDTLLVGASANTSGGAIYSIGLNRNAAGHIIGFVGVGTKVADAPSIDGGLAYAPNGTLMFTEYPGNSLGELLPGSTTPDKTVNLTGFGISSSVGTLQWVPTGLPGAGSFKIASYSGGGFYDVSVTEAADHTYDVTGATQEAAPGGGPEGVAYVPPGSVDFPNPSVLVALYSSSKVVAYDVDANGAPKTDTARDFITGLAGVEGGHIDAQTNDFMFSTFNGGNRVIVVNGFGPLSCRRSVSSPGVTSSYDPTTGVTTITGTGGDDIIAGTNGADVINAGDGNDTVCGRRGADVINGEDGRDVLSGQDAADQVNGDAGPDKVLGNNGEDTLTGGTGNDVLIGGKDADSCDGGADTDRAKTCETITGVP